MNNTLINKEKIYSLSLTEPIIFACMQRQKYARLTYTEMLEEMVLALSEANKHYQQALIEELQGRKNDQPRKGALCPTNPCIVCT